MSRKIQRPVPDLTPFLRGDKAVPLTRTDYQYRSGAKSDDAIRVLRCSVLDGFTASVTKCFGATGGNTTIYDLTPAGLDLALQQAAAARAARRRATTAQGESA